MSYSFRESIFAFARSIRSLNWPSFSSDMKAWLPPKFPTCIAAWIVPLLLYVATVKPALVE